MVEIKFGEYYEKSELAGMSVAEAREEFETAFGIPEKAKAVLNGRAVKKDEESQILLSDDDKLAFRARSRKGLVAVGALLLALAVSGVSFAYTQTTATTTTTITAIGVSGAFVDVTTANKTSLKYDQGPSWNIVEDVASSTLANPGSIYGLDVGPAASPYTGDLRITIYLNNPDTLNSYYTYINLGINAYPAESGSDNWSSTEEFTGGDFILTLTNGYVSFVLPYNSTVANDGYEWSIVIDSILYYCTDGTNAAANPPAFYIDVRQG